jgi:hypothetical protein
MHTNNYTLPRPPDAMLDQCHQVVIGDPAVRMWQMKRYCRDNNLSLIWSELVETSDVSAFFDEVSAFWFSDAKDAVLFTLKFKQ